MTGYLLIDKPKDFTSFQCINHIKKIIKIKTKIGHTGTLDPFATGLLIICIGREATKEISTLLNLDKTYIVTAKLGELTDTLDKTGAIIEEKEKIASKEEIEHAMSALGSEYVQTPPIYSALKYKGQPLHKLARKKKIAPSKLEEIIKEKSRKVQLYNLEFTEYSPPFFTFSAHVSKGTYVRSLANDIAQRAGSYATTYELQRTKIGKITLEKAIALNKIQTIEDIEKYLLDKEEFRSLLSCGAPSGGTTNEQGRIS